MGAAMDETLDEFIDLYVYWREECAAVRASYERWCTGPAAERDAAYEAYRDALDREQLAAEHYQEVAEEIAVKLALTSPADAIRAGLGS
jgi:hypothetical protein